MSAKEEFYNIEKIVDQKRERGKVRNFILFFQFGYGFLMILEMLSHFHVIF